MNLRLQRSGGLALLLVGVVGLGLLPPRPCDASWPADGLPLTTPGINSQPSIIPDQQGGAIVVWHSGLNPDIYAQRITAQGAIATGWPLGAGRLICAAPHLQEFPVMLADSAANTIFAWQDSRNGNNYDIYAQRVLANGALAEGWPASGLPLCTATGNQHAPVIVGDGSGGAIVVWYDARNGRGNYDIYAQRITPGGGVASGWPSNGLALCTAARHQLNPAALPDGAGGAFVVWQDYRSGSQYDIYVQHVGHGGALAPDWPSNGRPVCTAAYSQVDPVVAADDAGGLFIVWQDSRTGTCSDIHMQHLGPSGAPSPGWATDGIPVCTAQNAQYYPVIARDGQGGAFVAWQDFRSGVDCDIYGARVTASGALGAGWQTDGNVICAEANGQFHPRIANDGGTGEFVTWYDNRGGSSDDIYIQHVDAQGHLSPSWPQGGLALCTAPNAQYEPVISTNNQGTAVVAWLDQRSGDTASSGIYAQGASILGQVGVGGSPGVVSYVEWARPNPFQSRVELAVMLAEPTQVDVRIFDVAGRRVCDLGSRVLPGGRHVVAWDGRTDRGALCHAGVYLARIHYGGNERTLRLVRLP